jgi:hypothetical protein
MLPQYATEQLIDNIKRRCAVPTSQLTYTDEDFTLLANDTLQDEIVPLIMSTREEYFVDYYPTVAPADGIIEIPKWAIGAKLRSVVYVQQTSPLLISNLPRIDFDVVAGIGFVNNVSIAGFYVQNNSIHLYPNTSVPTGTPIWLYFYRRTLTLAEPAEYGQVVSVDLNTNTIVLDNVPTDWDVDTELNSISSEPNFSATNSLMTVTAVSSPSIIVDDVTGVAVGDYISDYGYSAIPQVPVEAHGYLAQLTAVIALEGLGDREGAKSLQEKAERIKTGLMTVISQRVDGSVKKVINPNGGLRLGAKIGRWGWYRGAGF